MENQDNKPKDSAFRQQRLRAFKPVHTAKSSAVIFLIASLFFFTFGILLYVECNNQTEYKTQYNEICTGLSSCFANFNIASQISAPVFLYYEMENFYQNYRLYVKSMSYTQLRGDQASSTELANCNGARYNKDFIGYYTGKTLAPDDTARPCGLIARSVFNDTFIIADYDIEVENIVSSIDRDMFINQNDSAE